MQIKMENPPTFIEVLSRTPGPELFNKGWKDLTAQGNSIFGLGLLAIIGAYFVLGLASAFVGPVVVCLAYTVIKVKRALEKYGQIQEALKALNASTHPEIDLNTLKARAEEIKAIKSDSERLAAFDTLAQKITEPDPLQKEALDQAVTKLERLWRTAKFESRSNEASPWEGYTPVGYVI